VACHVACLVAVMFVLSSVKKVSSTEHRRRDHHHRRTSACSLGLNSK
jgi:hypothetical protein